MLAPVFFAVECFYLILDPSHNFLDRVNCETELGRQDLLFDLTVDLSDIGCAGGMNCIFIVAAEVCFVCCRIKFPLNNSYFHGSEQLHR